MAADVKILAVPVLAFCVAACGSKPKVAQPAPLAAASVDIRPRTMRGQACGRAARSPVVLQKWPHGRSDLCDAAGTNWFNVPHEDRACAVDAECVVVSGSCFVDALNVVAKAKLKYAQLPCANPAQGECQPWVSEARCRSGCCVAERR